MVHDSVTVCERALFWCIRLTSHQFDAFVTETRDGFITLK
ncbi:hypothetical protein BRPE64_ACDS10010 [Caballeronia insecticola]|uniref:Uncharacterized protein n=1 Tax=Caballeronia insecticola TaxID=758793 RepID=R4WPI0_9BURK|nr:hypothetical protein BRPE64_ACDS10010 [Caballeronia insecticola]